MTDTVVPHRYLSPAFVDALEELASSTSGNWWQDVLRSDDLFIAVRRNSLNVYYWGASIFKIDWVNSQVVPSTHIKYLVRQAQAYVPLSEGRFLYPAAAMTWDAYEGQETLRQMMRTAIAFAGPEKSGLHPLLVGDPAVIDVEVALTREAEEETGIQRQDRLDAALIRLVDDRPTIVFCEAKHFTNSALRANSIAAPAVVGQVTDYESAITRCMPQLAEGYANVAKTVVRLHAMKKQARGGNPPPLHPAILALSESSSLPAIDPKPHLLIFGFDKAQRDDPVWQTHLQKLEQHLSGRVRAIGNPTRQSVALR